MNKQINLRLAEHILKRVEERTEEEGYGGVQDYIREAIREKSYERRNYTMETYLKLFDLNPQQLGKDLDDLLPRIDDEIYDHFHAYSSHYTLTFKEGRLEENKKLYKETLKLLLQLKGLLELQRQHKELLGKENKEYKETYEELLQKAEKKLIRINKEQIYPKIHPSIERFRGILAKQPQ